MRVLIFGNYAGGKIFYGELIEWLAKSGVEIDLLDWGSYVIHHNNFTSVTDVRKGNGLLIRLAKVKYIRKFAKVLLVKKTLKSIQEPYDIINVHYGNSANNPYLDLFRLKAKKLVVTIWGSDYDRVPDEQRQAARKLYNQADVINFGNPDMRYDFTGYYNGYKDKVALAGFGDSKLEKLLDLKENESQDVTRKKLSIPEDSFIITCGYKAFHVLQHFKMIEAIEHVKECLPDNYLLVFPLAYHRDEEYVASLKKKLQDSQLNHMLFEDFLGDDDLIRLRISSNVYLTIPITDGASFSLLEYLTAGNVVIAGDWLPYDYHEQLGLWFHSVKQENLASTLAEVLANYPEHLAQTEGNAEIVLKTFCWPEKVKEWLRLYQGVLH